MVIISFTICIFMHQHTSRIGDYTLQVTGEESYIHGQHELSSFKAIRRYADMKV